MNEDTKKFALIGLAVVALAAAVFAGMRTMNASYPGEAEAQIRSEDLARLANRVKGNYDALTAEEKKRVDAATNNNGKVVMSNLYLGPR